MRQLLYTFMSEIGIMEKSEICDILPANLTPSSGTLKIFKRTFRDATGKEALDSLRSFKSIASKRPRIDKSTLENAACKLGCKRVCLSLGRPGLIVD